MNKFLTIGAVACVGMTTLISTAHAQCPTAATLTKLLPALKGVSLTDSSNINGAFHCTYSATGPAYKFMIVPAKRPTPGRGPGHGGGKWHGGGHGGRHAHPGGHAHPGKPGHGGGKWHGGRHGGKTPPGSRG